MRAAEAAGGGSAIGPIPRWRRDYLIGMALARQSSRRINAL